jgi:hypothetical protein
MSDTLKGRPLAAFGPYANVDEAQLKRWSDERQREYEFNELLDRELGIKGRRSATTSTSQPVRTMERRTSCATP